MTLCRFFAEIFPMKGGTPMKDAKPASNRRIDLATEPDFDLGPLRFSPSTCRVHGICTDFRIEPRVMEVLLTLHRSTGRTVTRDQLMASCWAGRVISDDAVARVIGKIRQLSVIGGQTHF